jgi:hypothetical protein
VSLSLRNELRIVFCRNQVLLIIYSREITIYGILYQILDRKAYPCSAESDNSWAQSISTLESAISNLPKKPKLAQVILSNEYLRYMMIPWNENLSDEVEEMAYAKHSFSQLYGSAVESWEIRLDQAYPGSPQLACAMDGQLLQALRDIFSRENIKLQSLQPQLMTAFNNCKEQFKDKTAWFALYEQNSLCLGLVQQGNWRTVRMLKVGEDWLDKLPELLDREVYLNESGLTAEEVYLWAPEYWRESHRNNDTHWIIHNLHPLIRPSLAHEYDQRYVMGMCG